MISSVAWRSPVQIVANKCDGGKRSVYKAEALGCSVKIVSEKPLPPRLHTSVFYK